jgi:hypothetical protein
MNWIKRTFYDVNGDPSFNRQAAAVLIAALVILAFMGAEVGVLYAIAGVISTVLLGTAFKRKE